MTNTAWSEALSVLERLAWAARVSGVSETFEGRESSDDAGVRQFERWRATVPFASGDAELASPEQLYGCSSQEVARALVDAPAIESVDEPSWLSDIRVATENGGDPAGSEAVLGWSRQMMSVAEPFVALFRERVTEASREMATNGTTPFASTIVSDLFVPMLERRLSERLLPALIADLHLAKESGDLSGETPEARFLTFADALRTTDRRVAFYARYPVLARQCATLGQLSAAAAIEFASRLASDWSSIQRTFALAPDDQLNDIDFAGDMHGGSRAVVLLRFTSGGRLVYKPRSIAIAGHFQTLLEWINERNPPLRFRPLRILAQEDYGWIEYIQSEPCADLAAAQRFFKRQGCLLALLYVLSATDIHNENTFAVGEDPVVIDLETLFQPELQFIDRTGVAADQRALLSSLGADSPQWVGLLPNQRLARDGRPGIDMSGLGGGGGDGASPLRFPVLMNAGTDAMRVELRPGEMAEQQNRAVHDGETLRVDAHRAELVSGFKEMGAFLLTQKDAMLSDEGPLSRFTQDRTRVLLRPTVQYGMLLASMSRPDILGSGVSLDTHLDRFLTTTFGWTSETLICKAEREDLWNVDVPVFYSTVSSTDLWTSRAERAPDFFRTPGLEVARRRISALTPARVDALSWEIEALLDCSEANRDRSVTARVRQVPIRTSARGSRGANDTAVDALSIARALGDVILRTRADIDGLVNWPGVVDTDAAVIANPAMGPALYDGVSGVALYLAYLGETVNDDSFRDIAHRAQLTAARLFQLSNAESWALGAFGGIGGYLFLLAHLSALWPDESPSELTTEYLTDLSALIPSDEQYDVINGAAGLILALLAIESVRPTIGALDVAVDCGWHLVRNASPQGAGVGWKQAGDAVALTGFGHGASGIAWSLLRLHDVTRQPEFHEVAKQALAYETSLIDERAGGWPDLRGMNLESAGVLDASPPASLAAWCSGAGGIGLARCRMARWLPRADALKEIELAVHLTMASGFGHNHSLCHGDLGNRELLLEARAALRRPSDSALVDRVTRRILSDIADGGCKTGIQGGVASHDLMRGTAGIGYGLLRVAAPTVVPSVLLIDPPVKRSR